MCRQWSMQVIWFTRAWNHRTGLFGSPKWLLVSLQSELMRFSINGMKIQWIQGIWIWITETWIGVSLKIQSLTCVLLACVASWSLTQEVRGLKPFTKNDKYFSHWIGWIHWKHLGKTQVSWYVVSPALTKAVTLLIFIRRLGGSYTSPHSSLVNELFSSVFTHLLPSIVQTKRHFSCLFH